MVSTLKVVQIPTQKFGWTFYAFDRYDGLHQYSQNEISEMVEEDQNLTVEIVDSLEELGVYEN